MSNRGNQVQFQLLGPLRVDNQGHRPDLGGAKQQLVLAALLLAQGSVVSTDRLVDLLWEDNPPKKPNVTLRSYVSHLRKVLEPDRHAGDRARTLVTRAPGYALEIDTTDLDVARFEQGLASARQLWAAGDRNAGLDAVTDALLLWQTDRLDDGLLAPFEAEVARLEELRLVAIEVQQDLMLELGRHAEAIPTLEGLVTSQPLRERLRCQLMLALHRADRQADALATYQAGRTKLVTELGLEPGPALRALEAQILADDPDLAWIPPEPARDTAEVVIDVTRSPAPIGREEIAEQLLTGLDEAHLGQAMVTTLIGEPGIGKTTVLEFLDSEARSRGWRTLWARCHEGTNSSPLRPWLALLRNLLDQLPDRELGAVVAEDAPIVAGLLPHLEGRLNTVPASPEDQFRLFDAITRTVRRSADLQPVCCLIEDLHWSDAVSVRLLNYAVPELQTSRVGFLTSWRDTEQLDDDLAAGLADLSRFAGSRRYALGGLTSADATAIAAQTLGAELDDEVATKAVEHTNGNPLFLNEVLRTYAEKGHAETTDTIRDLLGRRLSNLPAGSSESLTVGGLCTHGFTEQTIALATDSTPDAVLDQLEAALAAGLIEEDPDAPERFRFSHAIIADTLLAVLSTPRRARLHARLGLVLEQLGAPEEILAHHFLGGATAGTAMQGAEYAHRAAIDSIRLWNHDAAGRLLESGLQALGTKDADEGLRADLLIDLTQVRKHQQRSIDAHQVAEQAFQVASDAGDAERMAIAAIVYCGSARPMKGRQADQWLGYWCPAGPSIAMLNTCLGKVPDDHWLRVPLLVALAGQHFGEYEDLPRCEILTSEAIELARKHDDPDLLCATLHNTHYKFDRTWPAARRGALLDEILSVAQRHGNVRREVDVRRARMVAALDRRDPEAATEEARAGFAAARSSTEPLLQMKAEVARISMQLLRGELADADLALTNAFETYASLGEATLDQFGLQFATLRREQGRLDEVEFMLRLKLDGYPGPAFAAPLAHCLLLMGKPDDAAEIVSEFSHSELTSGGEGVLQFVTQCFFGEVLATLGDATKAGWVYEALRPAAGRTVSMFDGMATFGCTSLYLGQLAITLERFDEAAAHLDEADAHHNAVGARPYVMRTLLARADLAAKTDADPQPLLAAAASLGKELDMTWVMEGTSAAG